MVSFPPGTSLCDLYVRGYSRGSGWRYPFGPVDSTGCTASSTALGSRRLGAPEQLGRGASTGAVALVRSLMVVELEERLQAPLELREPREEAASELDAPVLVEQRSLKPLDKPVGPGMPQLGPCLTDTPFSTRAAEEAPELAAAGRAGVSGGSEVREVRGR